MEATIKHHSMWYFSLFILCICPLALANTVDLLTIPLDYRIKFGIYTTTFTVITKPAQEIELIVDTGSSSLVVVGGPVLCPLCKQSLTEGELIWHHNYLQKNNHVELTYLSGIDQVIPVTIPVKFGPKEKHHQLAINAFVIKKSSQPASILGLMHQNLRKQLFDFSPFLSVVQSQLFTPAEFSLLLCEEKGKSFLYIGKKNFAQRPLLTTERYPSPFYETHTLGFFDKNLHPVATTRSEQTALLDTGTGGLIILNADLHQQIVNYLQKTTKHLPVNFASTFWNNNYCVKDSPYFSTFPLLNIGFKEQDTQKVVFLKLPSSAYINSAGCPRGFVRLVFSKNPYLKKKTIQPTAIVLGTPFLNEFVTKINLSAQKKIEFFDKEGLCQ